MTDHYRVLESIAAEDGAGVRMRRFALFDEPDTSPFLLVDRFDAVDPSVCAGGFPAHPHRGIETLTYMQHGAMRHEDSMGHQELITDGGVQWMSAGSGVIHSEMPAMVQGRLAGFQIWNNLPAKDKMSCPQYQQADAADLPVWTESGVRLRAVAGCWTAGDDTVCSPVSSMANRAAVADLHLEPEARWTWRGDLPRTVLCLVYEGTLEEPVHLSPLRMLVVSGGSSLTLAGGKEPTGVLLLAGQPLAEPVVHWGPFVMNTREDIEQAIDDYRRGRLVRSGHGGR